MASGPPNVPKSCMTPSCHRNARHCAPRPKQAMGSGIAFVAIPTTWPRPLMLAAEPSYPPRVPRSAISPSFQRTARDLVYARQRVDLTVFRTADDLPIAR